MSHFVVFIFYLFPFATGEPHQSTVDSSPRLPYLFHLDDYDTCLSQINGVYCVGKFQIYNEVVTNPTYDLIVEHSKDETNYNRTFLHRGYCLNTRCQSAEHNVSARFEDCVDQWAQRHSLRTRLHTLHYCHTSHEMRVTKNLDTPQRLFVYAICFILLMNGVGTVYDLLRNKNEKKRHEFLLAWSVPSNWKSYKALREYKDHRQQSLQVLEGMKVVIAFITVNMHSNLVDDKTYHFNAHDSEKFLRSLIATFFAATTTGAQIYVFLLTFFMTLSMLLESERRNFNYTSIPKLILKKIVRMWPLYIFAIAFAATWWPSTSNGPLWPVLVESESNVCRRKFWAQIFFVHNYFRKHENCIVTMWILAVETQLIIFITILLLVLIKYRQFNLRNLTLLYVAALLITFAVVYTFKFKSVPQMSTPEALLPMLVNENTFKYFYINPVNCLATSLAGVILGYIHYSIPINTKERSKYEGLYSLANVLWAPLGIVWACMFIILKHYTDPFTNAVIMVLDRAVVSFCLISGIYSSLRTKGNHLMRWNGWRYFTRLLYGVAMIHWQIDMFLVARKRTLHEAGVISSLSTGIVTWFCALLISLPLTILIDYPLQKRFQNLLSKLP